MTNYEFHNFYKQPFRIMKKTLKLNISIKFQSLKCWL